MMLYLVALLIALAWACDQTEPPAPEWTPQPLMGQRCIAAGDSCTGRIEDCCVGNECVGATLGSYVCAALCDSDGDCNSHCCTPLEDSRGVCAPVAFCQP